MQVSLPTSSCALAIVVNMADVSTATPIDLPLERSLYVGNFFRAILYGELSSKLSHFFATQAHLS